MRDRGLEAATFLCEHMDEDRHIAVLRELEVLDQRVEVVPVDRAKVTQAEFFEQR